MKIDRTKNATRNIVFGSILEIYPIVISFFYKNSNDLFYGNAVSWIK